MWIESMGMVVRRCIYRFPRITYPYSLYLFFFKMFFVLFIHQPKKTLKISPIEKRSHFFNEKSFQKWIKMFRTQYKV